MGLKLAHLILAHTNPQQLERLVKRLQHEHTDIYIHLDAKSIMPDFEYLSKLDGVYFINERINVSWGTYSIVHATLCSMQEILDAKTTYSHINLLSGQDYPLKKADDIYNFFNANQNKSFIECPVVDESWLSGHRRLMYYDFGDYKFPGHYALQYVVKLLNIKKRMPEHLIPMGRSQWFTLTPESVAYVLNYIHQHPNIKRFFRMSFAADEILFQTILGNSALKDSLVDDNLRYIDFPEDHSHPNIITIDSVVPLMESGKLFARKFNPEVDSVILNYLDWTANNNHNPEDKGGELLQEFLSS